MHYKSQHFQWMLASGNLKYNIFVFISKLDMKPLSDTLKYVFLSSVETLPVIIASDLDKEQESKLLIALSEHKEVIR